MEPLQHHKYIISIIIFFCYIVSGCTSGNIRLHEGTYQYEGQLQICINRIWEGVPYSNWDYFDAEVACRQLWLFQVASTSERLIIILYYIIVSLTPIIDYLFIYIEHTLSVKQTKTVSRIAGN